MAKFGLECELVICYQKYTVYGINNGKFNEVHEIYPRLVLGTRG